MSNTEQAFTQTTAAPTASFKSVLRNRQFFALWAGQTVSGFGDWMALIALYSQIAFGMRTNPFQVSLIMICFIAPFAFLSPVAGAFVDRWNTKRTMISSDLIRAVIALGLAASPNMYVTCLLIMLLSSVSTFFVPCQSIAIPLLVKREELLVANSLNAQSILLNKIISPAAAGLLLGRLGARSCFYVDSASFVFSALMLSTIEIRRRNASASRGIRTIPADFKEGVKFIVEHGPILFLIVSMVAAVFALGAFQSLIAIYVRDALGEGTGLFGSMLSISGIGAILASFLIGRFGQGFKRVHLIAAGIVGAGIAVCGIAASGSAPLALLSNLWMGISLGCVMVAAQSLMHEEVPSEVMGRVSATTFSLVMLSQVVSFLISGAMAARVGIRNLYYVVGLALLATGTLGYFYTRSGRAGDQRAPAVPERVES